MSAEFTFLPQLNPHKAQLKRMLEMHYLRRHAKLTSSYHNPKAQQSHKQSKIRGIPSLM